MTVYTFDCPTDGNVKLLVPSKQIPAAANQHCKGTWNFAQQGEWTLGKVIEGFRADDSRVAIDSKKAVEDIERQGFHIARISITVTETIVEPK